MQADGNNLSRPLILLALSRLTEKDIGELSEFFRKNTKEDARIVLRQIENYLSTRKASAEDYDEYIDDTYKAYVEDIYRNIEHNTQLTKLSIRETTKSLYEFLSIEYPNRNIRPFNTKSGLRSWIARLLSEVSPSEILHALAIIREHANDAPERSWKLR
ncbi:hypothetical protein [Rhizobium laguerreae]|uniref:hypothetical protein n=1 Tax=Rhizobium laguerreae TaxID=1076926 RepID=UPI0014412719|nr:hypothetical protein [Rhizobium laguerreae]NKN10767.1 hypothetical protein [Rhizobium laguerreae]